MNDSGDFKRGLVGLVNDEPRPDGEEQHVRRRKVFATVPETGIVGKFLKGLESPSATCSARCSPLFSST